MQNAAVIRERGRLADLKRRLAATKRRLARLSKLAATLGDKISVLRQVTEVADGVALDVKIRPTIYGRDYEVRAVADDIGRDARVYTNVHTKKDFGLYLYDRSVFPSQEYWCRTGWRFDDAAAAARRWVTHGVRPTTTEIDMYCALGKLAPTKLSRTDRDVFEAAWIGGFHEQAKRLISERKAG
jgi:hypothetical protein